MLKETISQRNDIVDINNKLINITNSYSRITDDMTIEDAVNKGIQSFSIKEARVLYNNTIKKNGN